MFTFCFHRWIGVSVVTAVFAAPAMAGVVVYEEGDKKVELGGRIQIQYINVDSEDGDSRDQVFFRRLRPYIAGTVSKDWWGKLQFDLGKSVDGNEVAIKDAYMQYKGWDNMTLTIGNSKTPFSREFLASSKRQQTVERGFVGDHNFGSPDRQLGFKLEGHNESKKVTWAAAVGAEHVDPDARRIDFDTPVNNAADWNEGLVVAGRVDWHPKGFVKFDQGDFHSDETRYNFSLGFFSWENDGDNNTYTDSITGLSTSSSKADLDRADGLEVSAGIRGHGFSADAEYLLVSGDTVDSTFTGGAFFDGSTELERYQVEGGYMLTGNKIELAGKLQSMDADNFQTAWEATEVGLNYFWNKHKVKVQFTYRMGKNAFGVEGDDLDSAFMQWQFVF